MKEYILKNLSILIWKSISLKTYRDEAQNKIAALQERNEKDQANHEAEMMELQRIISHDNKIKQFMMVKADDRSDLKAEEEAKKEAMKGMYIYNVQLYSQYHVHQHGYSFLKYSY